MCFENNVIAILFFLLKFPTSFTVLEIEDPKLTQHIVSMTCSNQMEQLLYFLIYIYYFYDF